MKKIYQFINWQIEKYGRGYLGIQATKFGITIQINYHIGGNITESGKTIEECLIKLEKELNNQEKKNK